MRFHSLLFVLVVSDLVHGEAALGHNLLERNAALRVLAEVLAGCGYGAAIFLSTACGLQDLPFLPVRSVKHDFRITYALRHGNTRSTEVPENVFRPASQAIPDEEEIE